jgi:tRNA nucleotidyltransferase (CCA-adding enzyme)
VPAALDSYLLETFEQLPNQTISLLDTISQLAGQMKARVALVGGVVRDLALGLQPGRDLDFLLQGDAHTFARQFAALTGGNLIAEHTAFGTATIQLDPSSPYGGLLIDIAQARTESYERPGALPTVKPASLEEDLIRRDFSINAIALELPAECQKRSAALSSLVSLHDPFNGLYDLRVGLLRVLHSQSFRDDPTRILRGIRLASRLNLRFDPETRALLEEELSSGRFDELSPDRIRNELCLVLDEPRPEAALRLADQLKLTPHVLPSLTFTPALAARMDAARYVANLPAELDQRLIMIGLLCYDLLPSGYDELSTRYHLPKEITRLLNELRSLQQLRSVLATPTLPNSNLDRLLQPFSLNALSVIQIAEAGPIAEMVERYCEQLRPIATFLNGRDLQAMGLKAGPHLGSLLADLRKAQLDGDIESHQAAETWIKQRIIQLYGQKKD